MCLPIRNFILLYYLMTIIPWSEGCKCGFGSYCKIMEEEDEDRCYCELSDGLYEAEVEEGGGCNLIRDHCRNNPCKNGGTCVPTFGSYNCVCNEHHFGQSCHLYKNDSLIRKPARNIMAYFDVHEQKYSDKITFHIIAEELGEDFSLLLDDGNGLRRTEKEISFTKEDPYSMCLNHVKNYTQADSNVCKLIPERKMYVGMTELKYPVVKDEHRSLIRGKNRTIGRLDKLILSVSNKGQEVFSSTYRIFSYFSATKTSCMVAIKFKQCSMEMSNPVAYSRTTHFVVRAVLEPVHGEHPCTLVTDFNHTWRITGENVDKGFHGDTILRLKGMDFNFGTYMVEYTHDIFGSPELGIPKRHYTNFERCWFMIEPRPAVAVISGGLLRTFAPMSSVDFNASLSFEPNQIPEARLQYRWGCSNMKNKFCREDSAALRSRSFVMKNIRRTINFTLTVSIKGFDEKYGGKAFQTIKIIKAKPDLMISGFEIMCKKNCFYANFKELIILELKKYPSSGVVWTYSEMGGPKQPVHSIIEAGTPEHQIIIKEKALQPGKTYWFQASYGPNLNIYEIKTNAQPAKGMCSITPTSGEPALTFFVINCRGFQPDSEAAGPLTYEVYEVYESFPDLLVVSSTEETTSNLLLGSENLKVKVLDRMGSSTEQQLAIKLKPRTSLTNNEMDDLLENMSSYILGNDISRALSILNFIASLFGNLEEKSNVMDKLVSRITKMRLEDVSDAKAVLGSVSYLLSKLKNESGDILKASTTRQIFIILNSITSTIKSLRTEATSIVVGDDLLSLSELTVGALVATISSRDRQVTDRRHSTAMEYAISYYNYKKGSAKMLSCLEELGDALLDVMSPFQTPYKISQNQLIAMETKVEPVEVLASGNRTDPSGEGNVWLSFDEDFAKQYRGKILELQVTEFKTSPFWWKETKLAMNTHDLNVKLRIREERGPSVITKLKSPLQISLKVKDVPSKIISGAVTQPKTSVSNYDRDVYISIHKIERPKKGYGILAINFTDLVREEFDVLMVVNEFPEYDTVRKQGQKINASHSLYSSEVSKDTDVWDDIYFAILPSIKHSGGEVVNYSFEVLDSLCRVWTEDSWDIGTCSVTTSAGNIIHCHCTHLSLFGGSLLVAPNIVNPITDLKLFRTLINNPYVLMLVCFFMVIYFGLLIWADKMDRKDLRERGIIQLKDNFPGDKFGYLLAVFTSERANSGTSSNVGVMLIGSKGQSHPHIINHDKNLLQLGQDNWFLIYTENHLGDIQKLHVWHDNTGPSPDWFCFKIIVYDLASEKQYLFPFGKWLSVTTVNQNDWRLELMLEPEKYEEIHWQARAKENFFTGLRELHIWCSIFVRHPRSPYTRRQRLTVALIIILMAMMTSIMFYGAAEVAAEDDPTYSIGVREIIAILEATAISVVVSVLAAKLFMLSWPPRKQPSPPPAVSPKPEKPLPWYAPATIKKGLVKIRDTFGQLVMGFLIMDPLLPVQLRADQPVIEAAKSKKRRTKFLIAAWIINSIIIGTCCFFLVLYGLKFGPNKSIVWMSVVLFSVGKAIFLTQPLKILILSLLVAVVLKMENRDQLSFEIDPEGVDESLKDNPEFMTELLELRSQPMYHPLPDIDVMVGHQRRMKTEKHMWNNINFCFVFVTYLFTIIIILTLSSQTSPRHAQYIMDILKEKCYNATCLGEVHSKTKFIDYLGKTLIPSLYQKTWLNNQPLPREEEEKGKDELLIKGWALDYVNKMLGVPRLRQLRVSNGTCTVSKGFSDWFNSCNYSLSRSNIETNSFGVGWIKQKPYVWHYSTPKQTESMDLYGASGYYYPGGGYVQNLTDNSWDSIRKLTNLNIQNWLDEQSRLIVFEFNLFNVHSSLLSIVTLIVENLSSGVYTTRIYVDSAFQEFYLEDLDVKLIVVMCFLIIVLILSIIRIIIHVSIQGMAVYFKNWGHFLDFLIIFFGFSSIIAAIVRAIYFKTYSDIFKETHEDIFISFSYPFYQNDLTKILLCFFVVVTTIRLCSLCHYGKYFFIMRKALRDSAKYIFAVVLLTITGISLLAVFMYSCGKQTSVLFPAMPVPRIRFKDLKRNQILQAESITFSVCLNFIYFLSGAFITSIFIYFYGRAKHRLLWYGEGSECINRFQDIYTSLVNELSSLLGAIKGDKTLRLKGGNAEVRELSESSQAWDAKTRSGTVGEWGGYFNFRPPNRQHIFRRETPQESAEELIDWFHRTSATHNKICQQLDMIAELLDKQYEEQFCEV